MINKAENTLENQLVNRIKDLERSVRELKSAPQPIGGDILDVIATHGVLAGPFTMATNTFLVLTTTLIPNGGITLWNEAVSIYVDALDHQHTWPSVVDGTGVLTASQQNLQVSVWLDFEDTDYTTGK